MARNYKDDKEFFNVKGVLPHNVEWLVRGAGWEDQCGDQARFVKGCEIMKWIFQYWGCVQFWMITLYVIVIQHEILILLIINPYESAVKILYFSTRFYSIFLDTTSWNGRYFMYYIYLILVIFVIFLCQCNFEAWKFYAKKCISAIILIHLFGATWDCGWAYQPFCKEQSPGDADPSGGPKLKLRLQNYEIRAVCTLQHLQMLFRVSHLLELKRWWRRLGKTSRRPCR